MNFKSYAISRKLKNNSDLIKYLNEGAIPVEVIEKEFSEVFALYKDEEAELLSEDYREYLRKHVPVAFIPNDKGLDVKGNISDNVLDIISDVHGVEKDEVVSTVVHDVVETVSPNRKFNVTNVLFSEELDLLSDRVEEHKKQLVDMSNESKITDTLESKIEDKVITVEKHNNASYRAVDVEKLEVAEEKEVVEKEVAGEDVTEKEVATEESEKEVVADEKEEVTEKKEVADEDFNNLIADEPDFNIDEVIAASEVSDEVKEEAKEDDAELRKEIWNNFVMDLADKKMNERVATRQDLALAL